MCMDNKGMFCELVSSNALDTAGAFVYACMSNEDKLMYKGADEV